MKTKLICSVLIAVASTLLLAGSALEYLDPATVTLILYSIAAGIFVALYMVKLNFHRLMAFFKGKRAETTAPPDREAGEK